MENDASLDQRPPVGEAGQIGVRVTVDLAPACDANLPRQSRLDLGCALPADDLDRRARLATLAGAVGQKLFLLRGEGERQAVADDDADVMAEPLARRGPHGVRAQRIGDERDTRHLHGQRAGIDARGAAADLVALDQRHRHAAARSQQRDRRSVHAAPDDDEIVHARHSGAGVGIGMSA